MTAVEGILLIVCISLALCPPQFDPAIRLKEWLERMKP